MPFFSRGVVAPALSMAKGHGHARTGRPSAASIWSALLTLQAFGACTSTIVPAETYSVECEQSSQCVVVTVGDQCYACSGEYKAISQVDLPRFRRDVEVARDACPRDAEVFQIECVHMAEVAAPVCRDNVCEIPEEGELCVFEDKICRGVSD